MAIQTDPPKYAKRVLTDPFIRSLKPAPKGARYAVADAIVPGLKVRVTDRGTKTFILWKRFGGAANPAARSLGKVGALTLAQAREKARAWLELLARGIDPREIERQRQEAENDRRAFTFGAVMEEYLTRHVQGQRKARDVEREIRHELLPRWRNKPVTEITRRDVVRMVDEIKDRGALYQAHNVFGHVRTFFNWAIDRDIYGITTSPCDRLRPARVIGAKAPRQRVLTDAEIAALWRAAGRLGYPIGPLYRLLVLTGQRKGEVAGASWREFDLPSRLWTIPSERFKSNAVHRVPLAEDAMALLAELPRFVGGDFVFTTTGGWKPVNGFSKAKASLDVLMREDLGSAGAIRHSRH